VSSRRHPLAREFGYGARALANAPESGTPLAVGLATALLAAIALAAIGFSASAWVAAAWVLGLAIAALYGGLRHGIIWLEHRIVGRVVCVGNVAFTVALMVLGPNLFADAESVQHGRPAVLGVTGYRLALDRDGQAAVDFGPEPHAAPRAAYFEIPGIPNQSEGSHAVNLPVHLDLTCSDSRCTLRLAPTGMRRDFTVGVRKPTSPDWEVAGAVDIESGHVLRLVERTVLGGDLGQEVDLRGEPHLERMIPIEVGPDAVRFGDCSIPFDPDRPIYLPVLELRFMATEDGCRMIDIEQADILRGRWLKRAPDGSVDIPAHSFFELSDGRVRWYPLESHNLAASIVTGDGIEVADPVTAELEFAADEAIELMVFRRRFAEVSLGKALRSECIDDWRASDERAFGGTGTGCRRLAATLRGLKFSALVERQGLQRLFTVLVDRSDENWGHRVFLDIPFSAWEAQPDAEGTPVPRRHILLTGRWPEGASVVGGSVDEQILAVPFRLHGTTPFRAVLTLESGEEQDDAVLRIADATRRGEVTASRAELSIGPPESQVLVTYERPTSPHGLARGTLWPTLALAIGSALLALFGHRLGAIAIRTAAVTSTLALIIAYSLLQKSLVAYSVVIHPPHDWEAFDQLVVSAIAMPLAVAAAAAAALIADGFTIKRVALVRAWLPWALLGLTCMVALARVLASVLGREAIGSLRFVVVTPLLGALIWMCAIAAARVAVDSPAGRQRVLDAAVLVAGGVLVLSWWADKGAMLMLAVPVALAMVYHTWRLTAGKVLIWIIALGFAGIFFAPRQAVKVWSGQDSIEIPPLAVGKGSSCSEADEALDVEQAMEHCVSPIASDSDILGTLDRVGVLDTTASISSRRHPLRRLDWLEDGARDSECDAIDRFPTRDAMEVGFFRALVDRYRSEQDTSYLREQLLPFAPGVTNALLNDYVGLVTYLPQMPRGTFSTVAIMLLAMLLLSIGHGNPWRSLAGGAAVGAAGLLAGGSVLTIAANLDVFPNFAQSIPLLALRSHSALLLDALAVSLIVFGLSYHGVRSVDGDRTP
jgi:hypothetical protein